MDNIKQNPNSTSKKQPFSLFLFQSYQDSWQDYRYALTKDSFPVWDYIVLTASNEAQARIYEKQLLLRKELLPSRTSFLIVPDEEGKRIGSGGSTLSVLKKIREQEKSFEGLKILLIHSGGDSRRIPQYSALGKLFSPVPHVLEDGRSSTLFDELFIIMSSVPSRIKEGMLACSGDVLPLFNPLLIEFNGQGACAISFKEDVNTGKDHGVYLCSQDGTVLSFLHKQSVETLRETGATDPMDQVDIDTGLILFGRDVLEALWPLISVNDMYDEKKYRCYVSEDTCLSLYGDFQYPLAENSTLEGFYQEKAERSLNEALNRAREDVWEALRPFRMKALRFQQGKFIHFGTSLEILKLLNEEIDSYEPLGWKKDTNSYRSGHASYDSLIGEDVSIGENVYIERSVIHDDASIGSSSILSCVEIPEEVKIPSDVVLHVLKLRSGKHVCRIFGIEDDPKKDLLFGKKLSGNLWNENDTHDLWHARIYPECLNMDESIQKALDLYDALKEDKSIGKQEHSLCSSFNEADPDALMGWIDRMKQLTAVGKIREMMLKQSPVSEVAGTLSEGLSNIQRQWIEEEVKDASFSKAMRMHYYIGTAAGDENEISEAFKALSEAVVKDAENELKYNNVAHIGSNELSVSLPLRVNWGGGWSDTPPYCNENGGTVINCAITLNGKKPVSVGLYRIEEKKIIFESADMGVYGEFEKIEDLQSVGDPFDPFVLQKAALLSCGVIPARGGDLSGILDRLGGGFHMSTEARNVPQGSGLGTSSILAAACVKALFEFMNIPYTEDDLYDHVLAMEQLMSTGGGWQDQVGGVTDGIKFITSKEGIRQKLNVEHLSLKEETMKELNERFVLIFTGQRRLARNLLRDVVGRYIGNEPDTVYALKQIQTVASDMKNALLNDDIDEFARLLSEHWELSKMIDAGSTNLLIDQIFLGVEDLLDGKMVCGAGGGGFLQGVLKKNVTKQELAERLEELFPESGVRVWECELI